MSNKSPQNMSFQKADHTDRSIYSNFSNSVNKNIIRGI